MVKYQPAQAQFPALAWAGWGTLWGCEAGAAGGGRGGGDLFGAGILVLLQLAHRPDHRHHPDHESSEHVSLSAARGCEA